MSDHYDAIVIGAGPAGGAAALRLAAAGARTLVLDRQRLPRDKPCGGGLPATIAPRLDWELGELVEAQPAAVRFVHAADGAAVDHATPGLRMIRRRDFDLALVERAVARGGGLVTLADAVQVEQVREDADGVTVAARGGMSWRAAFVVGADGAAGITARAIGRARRSRPGAALDADVEVDAETFAAERGRATFEFGVIRFGYGWIFPKDGYLSCGIGSWSGREKLQEALDRYLGAALPPGSVHHEVRRGHPLPLFEGLTPLASERVLLAGDAASLIEPIMGEGIQFAMWSGEIAGDLIAERLAAGGAAGAGALYEARVDAAFRTSFEAQRRFIQPILKQDDAVFVRRFLQAGANYVVLAETLAARFGGLSSASRMPQS